MKKNLDHFLSLIVSSSKLASKAAYCGYKNCKTAEEFVFIEHYVIFVVLIIKLPSHEDDFDDFFGWILSNPPQALTGVS